MKKALLCAILTAVMLLSLAVVAYALGEEMTVAFGTPKIDGTIDDVWTTADRQQLGYCKAGDKKVDAYTLPEDCTVYASMLYDETSLYFLFEITDNEFAFESSVGDWKNDSIYLYVDEIGDGDPTWTDQQAQIALIPEDGWEMIPRKGAVPKDYELAYSFPTDKTCVIEFKYVVRVLDMKEGTEFTVDFQYNDSVPGALRDYCLGWSDETDDASNNSNCWGFATLGAKGASAASAAPASGDSSVGNWVSRDFTASFDDPDWHGDVSDIDFEDFWEEGATNARCGTYYVYLKGDGKGDYSVEFETKEDGLYEIDVCLMAWEKSVLRATNIKVDDSDWIRLAFDYENEEKELEQYITGLTINLSKGTHKFTLGLPEDFDDTTVKTLYFDYFFHHKIGEMGAALPTPTVTEKPAEESRGFKKLADAAAAVGMTPITGYEWEDGTNGFGSEGPENLWDGDVGTKFCTNEFPAESEASLDATYKVTGFAMATANDNHEYNGRSPNAWTISVSADGENWTELAKGDDTFFEEKNQTYYNGEGTTENVAFVRFEAEGTASGTFQVSELTLYGEKTGEKPAKAEPEPAPEPEPEPEPDTPTVEEVAENAAENVTEAVENVAEAVSNTAENAAEAVSGAVDSAKSGCGSFIGGGLIVLVTILGSAWIAKRK